MGQGTARTRLTGVDVRPGELGNPLSSDESRSRAIFGYPTSLCIAAVLLVVGALLRLSGITTQSLWGDDGFSLDYSTCDHLTACYRNMTSGHASEQFDILYFLILHLWREVFGDSTASLRSLSIIASVLALPVIWSTAATLFDRESAAWSIAFSALSGFALFCAHEVRPYAFLVSISSVQLWLLARARAEDADSHWKLLLIAASFIASWASILCLLFIAAIAVGDLLARRDWIKGSRWWIPSAIACIPAFIYYLLRVADAPPDAVLMRTETLIPNILFVTYTHLVGQTYSVPLVALRGVDRWSMLQHHWGELTLFIVICALLAWLIIVSVRGGGWAGQRRYGLRLLAFSTATYIALCLMLAAATHQNWLPRHAFALHVLLALFLPAAVAAPHVDGIAQRLRLFALSGLLALNVWSAKNYYFEPVHWRDDYRSVAAYLKEQRSQGRPAVMLIGKVSILRHYGDESTVDGGLFDRSLMPFQVRSATNSAREVLIVLNREFALEIEDGYVREWKPRGLVVAMMSPQYKMIDKVAFHYFTIYRFLLQTSGGDYKSGS